MRDIKFRGKRVDNGEWVYGTPVTYRDGYVAIYDGLLMLYGCESTTLSRNKVDPATVGQYTGLKDKNGVEIYEGDVILLNERRYEVVFDEHFMRLCLCEIEPSPQGIRQYHPLCAMLDRHEVIGNIHDNQELLITKQDIYETMPPKNGEEAREG